MQIDLSYNLIRAIGTNSFATASSCETLRLSYNPIKSVDPDAFQVSYSETVWEKPNLPDCVRMRGSLFEKIISQLLCPRIICTKLETLAQSEQRLTLQVFHFRDCQVSENYF